MRQLRHPFISTFRWNRFCYMIYGFQTFQTLYIHYALFYSCGNQHFSLFIHPVSWLFFFYKIYCFFILLINTSDISLTWRYTTISQCTAETQLLITPYVPSSFSYFTQICEICCFWVVDCCCCCLMPIHQLFLALSWWLQVNYQWHDDEVRFILDQHAGLDFDNASSLKQQSTCRHVTPLGHIILNPSQPVFVFLLNAACLAKEQQIPIIKSLIWPDRGLNPQYTTLEASTLTITPPMWFCWF